MELEKSYIEYSQLFGSATASTFKYYLTEDIDAEMEPPSLIYIFPYELNLFKSWEKDSFHDLFLEYHMGQEQIQIIQNFASELLDNMEDLNPKYAKLVNRHFWDLI